VAIIGAASASAQRPRARQAEGCADQWVGAPHDPANPLALLMAPGEDPLHGAHFFVDGPAHGRAARAIAQRLGMDPSDFSDDYSWAQFKMDHGDRFGRTARLLAKVADQ